MVSTRYGVITTVDSTDAVVQPPTSPLVLGLVGTAEAPVRGDNPNPPGSLPSIDTPILIRSLADAYAKGIGAGSLLTALTRIFIQTRPRIIVVRTTDKDTAPHSIPYLSRAAEDPEIGVRPNWFATPGMSYNIAARLPRITISGGGGMGAVGEAVVAAGVITAINVVEGGTGYTSAPSVTITDPDGNGQNAAATATVRGGAVTGFTVSNGGTNYATGTPVPNGTANAVMTAMQTEAEHEGVLFVSDVPPVDFTTAMEWLANNAHDRSVNIANQGQIGASRFDGSAVALGAIARNEAAHEVFVDLGTRTVQRVRTNPSNKVVRGITGAHPDYLYEYRYQANPANMLRSAGFTVITFKEGQWKLWGSDTKFADANEPLADISVRRVLDQLENDIDETYAVFQDEPMRTNTVQELLSRGQETATGYVNADPPLMESGRVVLDPDVTDYNTGDVGTETIVQIAGVIHRIYNDIRLQPL